MSARPLPYSDASSMTNTLVALRSSLMYFAAAGPCEASLPRARKKVFQPFLASAGLVADGGDRGQAGLVERRVGRLGLTGEGRADDADDGLVVDRLLGQCRGLGLGSPWESKCLSVTLQSLCFSLYCSTARSTPFLMLMPRLAASPVSAPKKPICRSHFVAAGAAAGRGVAALGATTGQGQCSDHDRRAVLDERTHVLLLMPPMTPRTRRRPPPVGGTVGTLDREVWPTAPPSGEWCPCRDQTGLPRAAVAPVSRRTCGPACP